MSQRISVRVTEDFHEQLRGAATQKGLTLADLVREMLEVGIAPPEAGASGTQPDDPKGANWKPVSPEHLSDLRSQVEYLQKELTASREEVEQSRHRSDTIIQQLSQQLDHTQLALEDFTRRRSVWERVKAVFVAEPAQ